MMRLLIALMAMLGSAQVPAEDLLDIYRAARSNDTRTAAARAYYRMMQERVPQAQAGAQSNLVLQGGRTNSDTHTKRDAQALDSWQGAFGGRNVLRTPGESP